MGTPDYGAGTVKIEGARELRRTLRQAGDDLSDLKDINRAAASIVASAAQPPSRTGRLAASVRAAGTKTAGIVRAGKKAVPYAGAVHWGRHYWPRKNHPRATPSQVQPHPFLSEAAQATQERWVGLYEERINKIIDNIQGA